MKDNMKSCILILCVVLLSISFTVGDESPQTCPENTHYGGASTCGIRCNRLESPKKCPHRHYRGCVCNDGYIPLDGNNLSHCVKPKDCPK